MFPSDNTFKIGTKIAVTSPWDIGEEPLGSKIIFKLLTAFHSFSLMMKG